MKRAVAVLVAAAALVPPVRGSAQTLALAHAFSTATRASGLRHPLPDVMRARFETPIFAADPRALAPTTPWLPDPSLGSPLRVAEVPARASWLASPVVLGSAFAAALWIDAGQTRGLAQRGWQGFYEANPLLGSHPSVGRINAYTAAVGVAVFGTAAALPKRLRPWFLGAALVVETLTVATNAREGLRVSLP